MRARVKARHGPAPVLTRDCAGLSCFVPHLSRAGLLNSLRRAAPAGLCLIAGFLSCRPAPAPALLDHNWPAREDLAYSLVIDSVPAGVYTLATRSLDTLGVPALWISSLTALQSPSGLISDSAVVVARRADLLPLRSRRAVTVSPGTARSTVVYSGGRAAISAVRPDDEKTVSLRVDRRTFDNDQLTTLLRVLSVPPDSTVELSALSGVATISIPVRVRSLPDERAVVPAGDFVCRRLRMNLLGRDVDLWYEPDGARRLVRYLDPAARLVMELLPVSLP